MLISPRIVKEHGAFSVVGIRLVAQQEKVVHSCTYDEMLTMVKNVF